MEEESTIEERKWANGDSFRFVDSGKDKKIVSMIYVSTYRVDI